MGLPMPKAIAVFLALGVALFCPTRAGALESTDVSTISCSLFLKYLGMDAPDYLVFYAWVQGYLAANPSSAAATDAERTMSALTSYCREHADDTLATASASVVKQQQ